MVVDGVHGPALRLHTVHDIALDDAIEGERFNLHVVDVGYALRVPVLRGGKSTISLSVSAGMSAARADAIWEDGLRFLLPCVGWTAESIEACQHRRDALRATGSTYDHTALGGFASTGLVVRHESLLVGGVIDHRLLRSTGDDPQFLHYVVSVRGTLGLAFSL